MYAEFPQIVDKSIDKLGAHMPIYGGIDKIPEILYGPNWSTCTNVDKLLDITGIYMIGHVPLHVYVFVDISIVIVDLSIVKYICDLIQNRSK